EEVRGATIYTNSNIMPYAIASASGLESSHVKFILGPDLLWELRELSNPDNGQQGALLRLASLECYGEGVFWNEITPDSIHPRSLFLVGGDPGLSLSLPEAVWWGRLEELAGSELFTIAHPVPAGSVPARSPFSTGGLSQLSHGG